MKLALKNLFKNRDFRETLVIILIAAVLFIGLRLTIQTYVVDGPSMEPNYWTNERILVDKIAYKFHIPHRGDIIIFQPPIPSTVPFIKRVIGLPGEIVEIKNGTIYVHKTDGSIITLQEPYIKEQFSYSYTSSVIPENEYFVLGDNRDISEDSHYGWFASRDKIIGKAWINIWPPHLWGGAATARYPSTTTVTTGK